MKEAGENLHISVSRTDAAEKKSATVCDAVAKTQETGHKSSFFL